jgi:pyruvate ferredoxin oxidoreductase delta subunit
MSKMTKRTDNEPRKPGCSDMPLGGLIIEAGNSVGYKTGEWKTKHPDIDKDKCSNCLLCFIYCPENCIELSENKVKTIDLDYCKGCGICAEECPKNAIEMRQE